MARLAAGTASHRAATAAQVGKMPTTEPMAASPSQGADDTAAPAGCWMYALTAAATVSGAESRSVEVSTPLPMRRRPATTSATRPTAPATHGQTAFARIGPPA